MAATGGGREGLAPIRIEISPGELLDRLSILDIKSERIAEPAKLRNVRAEQARLRVIAGGLPQSPTLATLAAELKTVNERLWEVEDALRECERDEDFGERFVSLARAVYRTNDRRAALKRAIDELLGSTLREEKSYREY